MARSFHEIARLWAETYGDDILRLSNDRIVEIANHCIFAGLVAKMDPVQPEESIYLISDVEYALAEAARIRAVADAAMPKLSGTEKLIRWAEEIRRNAIENAYKLSREARRRQDEYAATRLTAYIDGVLRQKDSAQWFIDNRFDFYEFQSIIKQRATRKFEVMSQAESEARSEISIQPKEPKALPLQIALLADGSLALCARSNDLVTIIKKHHLTWDPELVGWRKMPPENERIAQGAEIAADVVEMGFVAEVCDPEMRREAQAIINRHPNDLVSAPTYW